MRALQPGLRSYLWFTYLACLALLAVQAGPFVTRLLAGHAPLVPLAPLAVFALLALSGERIQLQLSGALVVSLTTPVHIATMLLFPPPYPLLIATAAALLSQGTDLFQREKPFYKRVFNVCHPALVVGLSSATVSFVVLPHMALRPGDVLAALPALGLLVALYYVLDTALLLAVFAMLEQRSPWRIWRQTYRPLLLPELAGSTLGVLAAVAWHYDPILLVLFVLPVAALHVAFRAIAQAEERAGALRRRGEQLEALLAAGQQLRLEQERAELLWPLSVAARRVAGATAVAAYLIDVQDPAMLVRIVAMPHEVAPVAPDRLAVADVAAPRDGAKARSRTLMLPLERAGGDVVGALCLIGVPAGFTDDDGHMLSVLANQAVIALDNAHLLEREQQARLEAEAAVRVRDDFLTAASHDLRTPLTVINGRIQIVRMSLTSGRVIDREWLARHMDSTEEAIKRIVATVEEITDAAQLQIGRQLSLHVETVDLDAMVRTVARTVEESSRPWRGARVEIEAASGISVEGDRARLERVAQNIIGNAIKYSPAHTPVHVEVTQHGEWVVLTVRDHGVGIPDDELPHVFTHFYRASTSIGIPGTGIGLAGSKTIVEQHGGRITLESIVGEGTVVTVCLPSSTRRGAARPVA